MSPRFVFSFFLFFGFFFASIFSWACSTSLCIGDEVIYSASDEQAQIIAIFQNGSFAIKTKAGKIISPVSENPLAITYGCARGLCIADKVINSSRDIESQVVGIFQNGTFAIQYDNGKIESPVTLNHLALLNEGKNFRENCISANGQVQLMTDLGTKPDRQLELIVNGETYGAGILGNEISESVSDFITTHFELDHERTLWASTIRNRDGSVTLLGALNPASGKTMESQIRLSCTKIQIP